MKTKLSISILFLTILLLGCQNKKQNIKGSEKSSAENNIISLTNEALKNINIDTTSISLQNLSTTILVSGKIDVPPQNLISVSMPLGGYLKSTNLLPGKYIEKGAVIAVMEDQQYIQLQQEYLTTKLKLEFAEKEYIRQRDLNVNKATSDKIFQMAESDYKSLRINLNGLAEKLKLININPYQLSENNISKGVDLLAPINCYVSKINVNIGKFVNPSDVLFELINPNDIHLNLNVYEKDINKIQIGQRLVAYTNNQPNVKHQCQIIQVSRDLSETHAAEVHCHFDHYDQNLLPGMYMNAEIKIKNTLCQVIPQESIVTYEGKNYVFLKLDKNHYSMKEVSIGIRDKDWLEILNYADFIGSCIIRNGAYTLLMKLKNTAEE